MSCVKRDISSSNIVLACNSVILDIEGTTSSITFVKDVLFPYVRDNLQEYISKKWDTDSFQETISALRIQADEDKLNNIDGVVIIPENCTKDEILEAVTKNILWLMDNDRKTKSLKDLQGFIMEEGYLKGDLKGHVYDDVEECLKSWSEDKSVYIYSSGSIKAQKLLFANSIKGDLLKFIKGHFDTSVGPKRETDSYRKILENISCPASEAAFFTDVPQEARAAKEAGLAVVLVTREGNEPLSDEEKEMFPMISSLDVVEFESSAKKLKLCNDKNVNIQENKSLQICSLSSDNQTNPHSSRINSGGDVEMSTSQTECKPTKQMNNASGEVQLLENSENSALLTTSSDEQMLEVQSSLENKIHEINGEEVNKGSNVIAPECTKSDISSDEAVGSSHNVETNNEKTDSLSEKTHEEDHQKTLIVNCAPDKGVVNDTLENGEKINGATNEARVEQNLHHFETELPVNGSVSKADGEKQTLENQFISENKKMDENTIKKSNCEPTESEKMSNNPVTISENQDQEGNKINDVKAVNGGVRGGEVELQEPLSEKSVFLKDEAAERGSLLNEEEENASQPDKVDVELKGKSDTGIVCPSSTAISNREENGKSLIESEGSSEHSGTTVPESLVKAGATQESKMPVNYETQSQESSEISVEGEGKVPKCNADSFKPVTDTENKNCLVPEFNNVNKTNLEAKSTNGVEIVSQESTKACQKEGYENIKSVELDQNMIITPNDEENKKTINVNGACETNGEHEKIIETSDRSVDNLNNTCSKDGSITLTCDSSKTENLKSIELVHKKEIENGAICNPPTVKDGQDEKSLSDSDVKEKHATNNTTDATTDG